jgi:hypothetical protein
MVVVIMHLVLIQVVGAVVPVVMPVVLEDLDHLV